MVFASPIFLFLFLPIVLAVYFLLRNEFRNLFLLITSLLFYAWGERQFVVIMMLSIALNYFLAISIERSKQSRNIRMAKIMLALAVVLNIGLLVIYKYTNFIFENIHPLLTMMGFENIKSPNIHLPIGISFFTFHALSYVIDIYRRQASAQENPVTMGLYISLFPQLMAGPIIRYHDIDKQLVERRVTLEGFTSGIKRFTIGLGKKVLIANTLAFPTDQIFSLPIDKLTVGLSWFAVLCYSMQLYFDFSGYSDMAIGLARMFGFNFMENFNYPYISQSVKELWRRWHISLTTWFRDYLYFPLGGNKINEFRTHFNLVVVFVLTGLWHGAAWTYVFWGLFNGVFLVIERHRFGKLIDSMWAPLRLIYTQLIWFVGLVFFRSLSIGNAFLHLKAMFGFPSGDGIEYNTGMFVSSEILIALGAGIIASLPLFPFLARRKKRLMASASARKAGFIQTGYAMGYTLFLLALFVLSAMSLASGTYNPFIYFRF